MEYPGIFFFPLSEPTPVEVTGMEQGVLARRIPDFLCICLNDDGNERAGLLEIRAADENGTPTGDWLAFDAPPEPDDVLSFLPEEGVEAAIVGTMSRSQSVQATELWRDSESGDQPREDQLDLDLVVIRRSEHTSKSLTWRLDLRNLGASCVDLARRIANEFSLPSSPRSWQRYGTRSATAFLHFLRGLDGAACLDRDVIGDRDPVQILQPFVEALEADPDFGLALRRLHLAINEALETDLMTLQQGLQLLDAAYASYPSDTDAASTIGQFMASVDENIRAEDWLRLAVSQPEPPAPALETLGVLLANRGETVEARNLWLTGLRVDGNPDFFAHLARLAFTEDQVDEAWDKVLRGLRRLSERRLHPGEWGDDEGRGGVMLRYLSEHLEDTRKVPPPDVVEMLLDLCEQIQEPEDRLDLGICLALTQRIPEAHSTLRAALPHVEDHDRRDVGAEYLAQILVSDFESNLKHAAEVKKDGDDATGALEFLATVSREVPQFWPAFYFRGKLLQLRADWQGAAEAFRQAAALRPDQPQIFARLALCQGRAGRQDEACESIARAVELAPTDVGLHTDQALILCKAGHLEEAFAALAEAETLDPKDPAVATARKVLLRAEEDAE